MKATIKTVFILSLLLFICIGCSKDDDNDSSTDTIGQNVFSGTISNYTAGAIDSLKFCYLKEDDNNNIVIQYVFGSSAVSTNGSFSMKLSTPQNSLLTEASDEIYDDVAVSDKTVKMTGSEHYSFVAVKNKTIVGMIVYANDVFNSLALQNRGYLSGTDNGWSYGCPVYLDNNLTVSGTHSGGSGTQSYKYIYNVKGKKGWNTFFIQHNYTELGTIATETEKLTTTLPANYMWYYYSLSSMDLIKRQNTKNLSTVLFK